MYYSCSVYTNIIVVRTKKVRSSMRLLIILYSLEPLRCTEAHTKPPSCSHSSYVSCGAHALGLEKAKETTTKPREAPMMHCL